jgi:multidrug efflux pump
MVRFFIDRPIFAWVIAIIMMLAGALSISTLPVSRFPDIAPPTISVSATYPGASAKVVADSVTQIIEQNMKGLDGLLFMTSTSDATGQANVTLTFDTSVNADIAQVQVQNKLQLATPFLPQFVQEQGISVTKSNNNFLMGVAFLSEDSSMSATEIDDFIATNVASVLARVPGVGSTQLFGTKYAMRIWLDPDKLATYTLSPAQVVDAIRAANQQVAIGQLGGSPAIPGQQLNATIDTQGRLQTPEEFRDIIIRGSQDGSVLTLGDIARVELGNEDYSFISRINGVPASGLGIMLATGANAVDTADAVKAAVAGLEPTFPPGLKSVVAFDSTPFITEAISEVIKTLVEAVALVFLVMLVFLQSLRATLIPTIAIPVVLLGTFAVLSVLGFSINMLTLFAMVLAIGLLVDDAIVVVENVERVMAEQGLSPVEATRQSMAEITGALVAIGVVLSTVFVPMAFIQGPTGVIYQQFAATIVSSIILSVLVALILTPALCATILKPSTHKGHKPTSSFFARFNTLFGNTSSTYLGAVQGMVSRPRRYFAVFVLMSALAALLFFRLPTSFLPDEDQGWMLAMVQTPVGATQERTDKVMAKLEDYFLEHEQENLLVLHSIQGFSFTGSGQNSGMAFIMLKDWDERPDSDQSAAAIAQRATAALSQVQDGLIFAFVPPAAPELGNSTGYSFFLTDTAGLGHEALLAARNQLLGAAAQNPILTKVRPAGMEDTPQLHIDIDERKATALGLSLRDINETLALTWGGRYIDDFLDRGRVKKVYIQADAPFRMVPENFQRLSFLNSTGQMVPFSSFAEWNWQYGSPRLQRFNGLPAMQVEGEVAPGHSSGTGMEEIEKIVSSLPQGIGLEWYGVSFLERAAGSQTGLLYGLSILIVFLSLAALYESWAIPAAVLLVAPLGILGAVLAVSFRGMDRDVYFQVAMLTTIGLTSKNAILIVEFAKLNLDRGMGLLEATLAAARDRFRPIIMTSLAFGFGVLPLAVATGAGSGAQQSVGTGVVGGMVVGTLLGVFFIPLLFVVINRLFRFSMKNRHGEP